LKKKGVDFSVRSFQSYLGSLPSVRKWFAGELVEIQLCIFNIEIVKLLPEVAEN